MATRKFNADLRAAMSAAEQGTMENVVTVNRGDSDGEFSILLGHPNVEQLLEIRLLAANVDGYPDNNSFIIFADDGAVPSRVTAAFTALQDASSGCTVNDMISLVKDQICSTLADTSDPEAVETGETGKSGFADVPDEGNSDVPDEGNSEDSSDDELVAATDFDEFYDTDGDASLFGLAASSLAATPTRHLVRSSDSMDRIKRDLRQVVKEGFKVGILAGMEASSKCSIFSISVRINKLGLPEEALEAWDVSATSYLVLLVRVEGVYPTFEKILDFDADFFKAEYRIGSCKQYKPSITQAVKAFINPKSQEPVEQSSGAADPDQVVFSKLFISESLEKFMSEGFMPLLKLRIARSVSWDEANAILNSRRQGAWSGSTGSAASNSGVAASTSHDDSPPDHATASGERSFPLVAMQFALRYFVGCTKFCMCCHQPLDADFEALKPYVCTSPLCLFQYLNMGVGRSIEHEVITQPYVVDLLVSFCYAAVQSPPTPAGSTAPPGLREYPVGLQIKVPGIYEVPDASSPIKVKATVDLEKVVLLDSSDLQRLAPNTWVVFQRRRSNRGDTMEPFNTYLNHGYILDTDTATASLRVEMRGRSACSISEIATAAEMGYPEAAPGLAESALVPMDVYLYEVDFDALERDCQAWVMAAILDSLPPITEIRDYLINHPGCSLKSFDRISPAAAVLLEWIVASNRSCIFQIDQTIDQTTEEKKDTADTDNDEDDTTTAEDAVVPLKTRLDEMVLGMGGWLQFHLAQGSPDKELRFNQSLAAVSARRHLEYPTLFAWHGSAMRNWHSILRHGLDFTECHNGRAYGHGVYFSRIFQSSLMYALSYSSLPWQNSALKVASAMSLNEIINAPDEFVSFQPHYVVDRVDWIQPRYLFVQCRPQLGPDGRPKARTNGGSDAVALRDVPLVRQDPALPIQGPSGNTLKIPLKAITRSRSQANQPTPNGPLASERQDAEKIEANTESDEEDAADAEFLFSEAGTSTQQVVKGALLDAAATDFRPGSLDFGSLFRMPPPTWATDFATRQIAREVKKLSDMQAKTPAHELGWYIDFDNLDNLFQWIVELHSFEPGLPLAQDMKAAGVTSVVLEIRFGRDFPYTPPFVRVVRPRFLPFANGGGGHVTQGGAMCMELLTNSGWTPANSMESTLLQVRMALCSTDPLPARLNPMLGGSSSHRADYGISEAVEAYIRACQSHGWKVPEGLREMTLI